MKKCYPFLILCFVTVLASAQTRSGKQLQVVQSKSSTVPEIVSNSCDTIGFPIPSSYSSIYQTVLPSGGYVTGTNEFNDKAKANFWDVSGNAATYLSKVYFGIGFANGPDLSKPISIVAYDGTSGVPGAVLGTINTTLGDMKAVAGASGGYAILAFNPVVTLPASKAIFLGFDFSGLAWNASTNPASKDSFAVLSTQFNEPRANKAWEKWADGSWKPFSDVNSYGKRLQLHVYPLVTSDQSCTLPVSFGKLSGKLANKAAVLSWTTYAEIDNKGFEVERSIDGLKYSTVGSVATKAANGNHSGGLSYEFKDLSPVQGQNLYRIKQIDKNGAFSYSNTISVVTQNQASQHIQSYYPNPTSGSLVVEFTKSLSGSANIQIADASGKIALQTKTSVTNSRNTVVNVASLKPGIYLLKLTEDNGTVSTIKFVKQ
ncbi:MAG TPA: T9SS type A sorting domain-containing protein [Phnomibacter sp.]|nr:T9SS type A sorting domain-containing protein [Phnomibacter sp.]